MKKTLSVLALVSASALTLAGCAPAETYSFEAQTQTAETVENAEAFPSETPEPTVTTEESATEQAEESAELEEPADYDEVVGVTETGPATANETEVLLSFLIEEEKLAHDVYTVLYDEYGSKVFGNILEAESKHQDQVLNLLDDFGVDDPRSDELGVFNDPELQELYDTLVAKGMLSETDAFEVGVMIEEKDIADITFQLETASDEDVIETLEKLRSGSENHLRAFNKQL